MAPDPTLRVVDFGAQPPLRSQTCWHAVAYGVSGASPPTLSFVRPAAPYVSIGYHRRLAEIDLGACERAGLPVFRRMIGGGPVYLDDGQLFFQITVPAGWVGPGASAIRTLLEPAVAAYTDVGIAAVFDEAGDIATPDGAKISGIGGGQIEHAAVAVGNLIERFDHRAMAEVLAVDEPTRAEVLRLMRLHVRSTPADPAAFADALVRRYAEALGARAVPGMLSEAEQRHLSELDARFVDPAWLAGPYRPDPAARQVKVRAGVWVFSSSVGDTSVVGSVVRDVLERVSVEDPGANGEASELARALSGSRFDDARELAARSGPLGVRVAEALDRCDRRSL